MKTIRNRRGGFTLLELLFVIVIMVTLVMLTAPQFSRSYQAFAQDRCVEDVLTLIALGHERAILEQVSYSIEFDAVQRSCQLKIQSQANSGQGFDIIPGTVGRLRLWPQNLDAQSMPNRVVFHPDGTATAFTVVFQTKGQSLGTIQVDPVLGKGTYRERA